MRLGKQQLTAPAGKEILQAGNNLLVTGKAKIVKQLENQGSL
jgi:hypothetical protein